MSTKIWKAVRVPIRRLNEYLVACHPPTLVRFHNKMDDQMKFVTAEEVGEMARRYLNGGEDEQTTERIILSCKIRVLTNKYREAARQSERNYLDVEAGLNIWQDGRYAYIVPIGRAELADADYAVDYHYQDQTDRPENITARQYAARERKWEQLCLKDHNAIRLYHAVVDFSNPMPLDAIMEVEKHFGLYGGNP